MVLPNKIKHLKKKQNETQKSPLHEFIVGTRSISKRNGCKVIFVLVEKKGERSKETRSTESNLSGIRHSFKRRHLIRLRLLIVRDDAASIQRRKRSSRTVADNDFSFLSGEQTGRSFPTRKPAHFTSLKE